MEGKLFSKVTFPICSLPTKKLDNMSIRKTLGRKRESDISCFQLTFNNFKETQHVLFTPLMLHLERLKHINNAGNSNTASEPIFTFLKEAKDDFLSRFKMFIEGCANCVFTDVPRKISLVYADEYYSCQDLYFFNFLCPDVFDFSATNKKMSFTLNSLSLEEDSIETLIEEVDRLSLTDNARLSLIFSTFENNYDKLCHHFQPVPVKQHKADRPLLNIIESLFLFRLRNTLSLKEIIEFVKKQRNYKNVSER